MNGSILFFLAFFKRKKKKTDNFQIILEISLTIISMQNFYFAVSKKHETFRCHKDDKKM